MSTALPIMQHVTGIVCELLQVMDVLNCRANGVNYEYDLEAVMIVPQAYITLRTETISDDELEALRAAVDTAFLNVHGDDFVNGSQQEALSDAFQSLAAALLAELKHFHNMLLENLAKQQAAATENG